MAGNPFDPRTFTPDPLDPYTAGSRAEHIYFDYAKPPAPPALVPLSDPAAGGLGAALAGDNRGGGGDGHGDTDQGPAGEEEGTPAGTNTRGSLSHEDAMAVGKGLGLAATVAGAISNPFGAIASYGFKSAVNAIGSLFGAKDDDPIDPVTGAIDNTSNNQNSVDNNNNSTEATSNEGVGTSVGSGQTEGASGAMGGPGGSTGSGSVGSGTGATGPGGGENGSGHDAGPGGGTDPSGGLGGGTGGGKGDGDGAGGGMGGGSGGGSGGASDGAGSGGPAGGEGGAGGSDGGYERGGDIQGFEPAYLAAGGMALTSSTGHIPQTQTKGVTQRRTIPRGLVASPTGGRADLVSRKVPKDSYVMPADVVSGLGQGNSLAGGHRINDRLRGVHAPPGFRRGGEVSVRLSGGEHLVAPEKVAGLGGGSIRRGAAILDREVETTRARTIRHLSRLPGPKR